MSWSDVLLCIYSIQIYSHCSSPLHHPKSVGSIVLIFLYSSWHQNPLNTWHHKHLFQFSLSWFNFQLCVLFLMSLNDLVLLCNTIKHLYSISNEKDCYFTKKGVSVWWNVIFVDNKMCSSSWMKDDLTEFIRSLQPTSWLPHGSNWNPVVLSDRRRSSSRQEARFLLPLPYFSFKKTNTGSWSGLWWDRLGLSELCKLTGHYDKHACVKTQSSVFNNYYCILINRTELIVQHVNINNSKFPWLEPVMSWMTVSIGREKNRKWPGNNTLAGSPSRQVYLCVTEDEFTLLNIIHV